MYIHIYTYMYMHTNPYTIKIHTYKISEQFPASHTNTNEYKCCPRKNSVYT